MTRLTFSRLTLRDFKDYRGTHVLDIKALGKGLVYMRGDNQVDPLGSNGAGKSTIWDAFMWVLTGRTTRGLRNPDVYTWGGSEHARVSLSVFVDGKKHIIKRSTARNGLWLDGEVTSQESIERLIGLTQTNIPHTIILAQKQELFFDLTPSKKMEILSETLQLFKWDERSQRARKRVMELGQDLRDLHTREVSAEEYLGDVVRQFDDTRKAHDQWEIERAKSDMGHAKELEALNKALVRARKDRDPFDLAYDSAETELRALRRDMIKKSRDYQAQVEVFANAQAHWQAAVTALEGVTYIADNRCPTCGQVIKDQKKALAHAKGERKKWKAAITKRRDQLDIEVEKKNKLGTEIVRMRKAEQDFAKKSDEAKDKLDHLDGLYRDIDKQIAVLKTKMRDGEANPHAETLKVLRAKRKELKGELRAIKEETALVTNRIERNRYWVDGFKQIRLHLLQDALIDLQETTQALLPAIGLGDWVIDYAIERETKAGTVSMGLVVTITKPRAEKAIRWEAWSGGESQRLLIAGALALSDVLLRRAGIETNMLVLDEPTRHMSTQGVSDCVDYLVDRAKNTTLFYCDHQAVESRRFAHVVTITKDSGGCHVNVA